MRLNSQDALLALLPSLTYAVSLSDMTPRASNLPAACNKIYTSQISGCGVSDFTSRSCSSSCVSALVALVDPIQQACGGNGLSGSNLVVAFLAGVGPQQICPDADFSDTSSTTEAPSATSAPSSTTTAVATSAVESESLLVDTSSDQTTATQTRTRTQAFSGTTTAESLGAESTTAASPTATTTTATTAQTQTQATSSSSTASATVAIAEQYSNGGSGPNSGGGSPFDAEGNTANGAEALGSTSVLVSLGIAVVVVAFLFR